jgi:hypothetical protein
MGFETPNLGLYNAIHGVVDAMHGVPDAKFGVVQRHTWGYRRHTWGSGRQIWGCTTPCMGLFDENDCSKKNTLLETSSKRVLV